MSTAEYYIADATRQRIGEAIRHLDFQPNAMAQGLAQRRSHTIGVIVASVANPFYPALIAGVEEVIGPSEYTLLLGSSDGLASKEAKIVKSMMQRQVDGVIMASVTMRDREVAHLAESGLDVVLASRNLSRRIVDTVVVDNEFGAHMAVEHLISHGHERVAHIAGPQNVVPFRLRLKGYRDQIEQSGLTFADDLVVPSLSDADAGAHAIDTLLDLVTPPTAVFVGSDNMAIGVLEACARRGVRIPDDLAIIGFDNIWVGRVPGVQLTTIDSKAHLVGRAAAHLLSERITARWAPGAREPASPETVILRPDLVVRRTCGCVTSRDSEQLKV